MTQFEHCALSHLDRTNRRVLSYLRWPRSSGTGGCTQCSSTSDQSSTTCQCSEHRVHNRASVQEVLTRSQDTHTQTLELDSSESRTVLSCPDLANFAKLVSGVWGGVEEVRGGGARLRVGQDEWNDCAADASVQDVREEDPAKPQVLECAGKGESKCKRLCVWRACLVVTSTVDAAWDCHRSCVAWPLPSFCGGCFGNRLTLISVVTAGTRGTGGLSRSFMHQQHCVRLCTILLLRSKVCCCEVVSSKVCTASMPMVAFGVFGLDDLSTFV